MCAVYLHREIRVSYTTNSAKSRSPLQHDINFPTIKSRQSEELAMKTLLNSVLYESITVIQLGDKDGMFLKVEI